MKQSMIGLRVKTIDLARQLQKCTGYMLPSLVYPAISSVSQISLPSSLGTMLGEEDRSRDQQWDMHSPFLSIALAAYTCLQSDKFYGMQHFWYNVLIPCFASFSRFQSFILFCNRSEKSQKLTTHGITTLYQKCCQ